MIDVACAIIRNEENEVLVVQRGQNTDHPRKWEFPGGKLKKGETPEECIVREIREELSIDIVICQRLKDTEYDYGIKQVRLIPFVCNTPEYLPLLSEHIDYRWIDPAELQNVDFSEADVIVAGNYLAELVSKEKLPSCTTVSGSAFDDNKLRELLANMRKSKEAEWLAMAAIERPEILAWLQEFSFSSDRRLAFRASWTFSKILDKHPELVRNYLPYMIDLMGSVSNESVIRSYLRIISMNEIADLTLKYHGLLADHCFRYLGSGSSTVAVRAYAMEVIYKLSLVYPELAGELSSVIGSLETTGPPGVIARGRQILKKLTGIYRDLS